MSVLHCSFCSSAALAAIQAKIPVVMGQPIVAWCLVARAWRISFIVVSLPLGTFLINWSTSTGAGITTVPGPHFFAQSTLITSTLGSLCCRLVFLATWVSYWS